MTASIELFHSAEFSESLWSLDAANETKLQNTLAQLRELEWNYSIHRIRSPHIVECGKAEAMMSREDTHWRLVRDLWKDCIEVAARHLLHTYRQLPYAISAEDSIYFQSARGMERRHVWLAGVYGGELRGLDELVKPICANVKIRTEKSTAEVRGADNKPLRPSVAIIEAALIG